MSVRAHLVGEEERVTLPKSSATESACAEGLLIDINSVATMLGRSPRSISRDDSAGRMPKSIKLGGAKKWRQAEIREWIAAGCPSRQKWEASLRASVSAKAG